MKILNSTNKNFSNSLNKLLSLRKKKVQSSSISVTSIVRDVKKNGDQKVTAPKSFSSTPKKKIN